MPTRNRPEFAARAVRYFLQQSYKESELIIVDDGAEPLCLPSCDSRIRYIRLDKQLNTGGKLNLGISESRGEVLQRIDDDDYYHHHFIETALHCLTRSGLEKSIVAWGHFLVYLAGEDFARNWNLGWPAGGSLGFSRSVWEKGHFREVPIGADEWFIKDHAEELVMVHAPELFMVVRHGGNTWTTMRDNRTAEDFLRSLAMYPKRLDSIIGAENFAFYRTLPALGVR
jgi:glycosyltransferase involved in cell wall biosynthesis